MRHTRQGALANGSAWTAPRKHRLIFFTRESRMACQRGTIEDAGTRGETSPASKESLPPGYSGSFFCFSLHSINAKGWEREDSLRQPRAITLGVTIV